MTNLCHECGAELIGRIDKKFCDDQCRSRYHNRINRLEYGTVRIQNLILKKNRSILKSLFPQKTISVKTLIGMGLKFEYFTKSLLNSDNTVKYYVYEYGYSFIGSDNVILLGPECD